MEDFYKETLIFFAVATIVLGSLVIAVRVIWGKGLMFKLFFYVSTLILACIMDAFVIGKIGITVYTLGFGSILGVLLIGLTLNFIKKNIILPIEKIEEATAELQNSGINNKIKNSFKYEFKELVESFNHLLEQVQKSNLELSEEKNLVQKKVEMAILESDEQNSYLAGCTRKMLGAIDNFANGDLTISVSHAHRNDDISNLFNGFNNAVTRIRQIMSEVSTAIDSTASVSMQIATSSEEFAAGSLEQSSQIMEIVSAIEQMTQTIHATTENTGSAARSAIEAGTIAQEGGEIINDTIKGIEKIEQVVSHAANSVGELGKNSSQISEIIKVIHGIADQTNLLALNAAIEAARAGEHGRGFAVVADEVRKLAERTSTATSEIATMIKHIQSDTNKVVESISNGNKEVKKGKVLAEKAGETMARILESTNKVVDNISQVATASEQQSKAAMQIRSNIEIINNVTSESSVGAEQVASSTEMLYQMAANTQTLIGQFILSKQNMAEEHSPTNTKENELVELNY